MGDSVRENPEGGSQNNVRINTKIILLHVNCFNQMGAGRDPLAYRRSAIVEDCDRRLRLCMFCIYVSYEVPERRGTVYRK
jgi:hypothetical protein